MATEGKEEVSEQLWYACLDGDIPKVKQLIHDGGDLSWKGPGGKSPLAIAAYQDHGELVELLITEYKADPEAIDGRGYTTLYWACAQQNVSVVKALVKCGVNIESQTKTGATPYLVSCNVGNIEIIKLLISSRVNRHRLYKDITPKQLAQKEKHVHVVQYLSEIEKIETNLEKATEEYIEIEVTKYSIHGAAGSGKTCLQRLMLNEPVPDVRESTDVVTDTILARDIATTVMANVQNSDDTSIDKAATPSNYSAGMRKVEGENTLELLLHETKSKLRFDSANPSIPENFLSSEASSNSFHTLGKNTPRRMTQWKKCLKSSFQRRKSIPPPEREIQCDSRDQQLHESFTSCGLMALLPTTNESDDSSMTLRWIYATDSGGQPAFQDVAPAFLRHSSIVILTLKLNERLCDYPKLEYMHKGKLVNQGSRKQQTNLQMVLNLARSLSSVLQPRCEDISDCRPKLMIIGTFYDQKELCPESLEEKNKILKEELKPFLNILIATAKGDLIHPFCTIVKPEEGRKEQSERLCKTILDCIGGKRTMKIRLSCLMFQFEIILYAESKNKDILTLEDCYEIGRSVQINDRGDVLEALRYLDDIGVIFYFHEVLPNLVFLKPQVILKSLSDLVSFSFFEDMELFPEYASLPPNHHNNLRVDGWVSMSLLRALFPERKGTLFSVNDFIDLLKHLFIMAEIPSQIGKYFFLPCVLPWDDRLDENVLKSSSTFADPIILTWEPICEKPIVPYGMFLGMINALLSYEGNLEFKLLSNTSSDTVFKHKRNAVFLKCTAGGLLLLIDRIFHIELRFNGDVTFCPPILMAVKKCITTAAERFHYHQDLGTVAECFMSKCDKETESHLFIVHPSNKSCITHEQSMELSRGERVWFESNIPIEATTDISRLLPLTRQLDTSDFLAIYKVFKPISHSWREVGRHLKLEHFQVKTIEQQYNHDVYGCISEMFDIWFKNNVECTTQSLKTVLENMNVKVTSTAQHC